MDIKRIKKILSWIAFGFLVAILVFVLIPLLPIKNNYSLKMVTSGSMSPTIKTGAIVIVKPELSYKVGDIITYKIGKTERDIVTHRIVKQTEQGFITRGDANNITDANPVKREQILGKVVFNSPYVGYAVNFIRSKLGFVLLIIIPAVIIIGDEIRKIGKEVKKMKKEKENSKSE